MSELPISPSSVSSGTPLEKSQSVRESSESTHPSQLLKAQLRIKSSKNVALERTLEDSKHEGFPQLPLDQYRLTQSTKSCIPTKAF